MKTETHYHKAKISDYKAISESYAGELQDALNRIHANTDYLLLDKESEIIICKLKDGKYYTWVGSEKIIGTLKQCEDFIKQENNI